MTDLKTVKLAELHPAKDNPRAAIDPAELKELAASIRAVGILEPIIVTPNRKGYIVVAGARRLAAAKLAGLTETDVIVKTLTDTERQEAMLIENLQRSDLTPLEEARAFARLLELNPDLSQKLLADRIGLSQSIISKRIALLDLTPTVSKALDSGGITLADAAEFLKLKDLPTRMDAALKDFRAHAWQTPHRAVETAANEEKRDVKAAASLERLKTEGCKVLAKQPPHYGAGRAELIGSSAYDPKFGAITPKAHKTESCHAAYIAHDGSIVYVCTKPDRHTKAKGDSGLKTGLSEAEKEKRRRRKTHLADLREAGLHRQEFVRKLFTKRIPAALATDALDLLIVEWSTREIGTPYHQRGKHCADLLQLDVKTSRFMGEDYPRTIVGAPRLTPADTLKVALALGVGMFEDNLASNYPTWPNAVPYFAFLERQGYETSKAERLELTGKAPKK